MQSERRKLAGFAVGMTAALVAIALCFGLPATGGGAHDLDIGIVGTTSAVQQIEAKVAHTAPGDYAFTRYGDETALRDAIRQRDALGGIVAAPDGTKVLIASAAGTPIAQSLRGLALGMAHSTGREVPVKDVVPYTAADPLGSGITSASLPLIFAGILPALALAHLFRRRDLRIGGAVIVSMLAGLAFAWLFVYGYGTVDGNYWQLAGGLALGLAAISLPALGLEAMFGAAGLAATSATMVLIANPLSGLTSAPEWLPSPWGAIGQLLPPGATGTVLRSNGFFDGNGALPGLLALAAWAVLGAVLCRVSDARRAPETSDDRATTPVKSLFVGEVRATAREEAR